MPMGQSKAGTSENIRSKTHLHLPFKDFRRRKVNKLPQLKMDKNKNAGPIYFQILIYLKHDTYTVALGHDKIFITKIQVNLVLGLKCNDD